MKRLKNTHLGEILKEEFLVPMEILVYRLSQESGLSQTRLRRTHGRSYPMSPRFLNRGSEGIFDSCTITVSLTESKNNYWVHP